MRDPHRIGPAIRALERLWAKHPQLRLGQLLLNAVPHEAENRSLYFIEDAALLKALEEFYAAADHH